MLLAYQLAIWLKCDYCSNHGHLQIVMSIRRFHYQVLCLLGLSLLLLGCSSRARANVPSTGIAISSTPADSTKTATPFLSSTNTVMVIPATHTPTPTNSPTHTSTPLPTDTPIPTGEPELVWNPAGDVIAPILLYHHISNAYIGNRYYVTPATFRTQLQTLRDWGYTSITVSTLVDTLIHGGDLPPRPVVITFDDGNLDIYQYAFPIMHEMGFVGTFYIVANRLHSNDFVDANQLIEMINDGWEVGSHSMSHVDLTLDHSVARYEILQSRLTLEDALGVPINTLAYPYGKIDEFVANKTSEYGYQAGMGLGLNWEHTLGSLFYLNRIEIQADYSLASLAALLPYSSKP
jgi:peptidoglycan/xylan/chitin deacetylase (PgdA/CDA1 family)